MVCGEAFEISTPRNVITHEGSRAFTKITCERHRLTPAEASRLSGGGPEARARFEEINVSCELCLARHPSRVDQDPDRIHSAAACRRATLAELSPHNTIINLF
jgi:hypothetical protein